MGVEACADLLQVSERTVRNWESGSARIPYTAYKLMRLLRGGKVLGPEWRDYFVRGAELVTPEGRRFHVSDLAWWSLLVRQAQMWRDSISDRDSRPATCVSAAMVAHPAAPVAADRRQSKRQAGDGALATGRPGAPLDAAQDAPVVSAVSIPRAIRPAAGKDLLPRQSEIARRRPADAKQRGRESDVKSLKEKGKPTGSLSLTLSNRPQKSDLVHQAETAVSIAPAVRS